MTHPTPDRFERMMKNEEYYDSYARLWVMPTVVAVKILRRQHAAMVRRVKRMKNSCDPDDGPAFENGYKEACDGLLAWLKNK